MKPQPHYINVLSSGPFIIVRTPTIDPPKWRHVLRALTTVMRSYGLRQKDISAVDGLVPLYEPDSPSESEFRRKLDAAFDERASHFVRFDLYDWDRASASFKLVRGRT